MANLKLTIELVPSTSWYDNMRKVMSQSDWDVLRKKTYAEYGHKCGICGATGRLNCHEVWEYDDQKQVQILKGFVALCDLCHHAKHIGLAKILADEGKLSMDDVAAHFCQVNRCDYPVFLCHERDAWATWERRSKQDWNVGLGEYAVLTRQPLDAVGAIPVYDFTDDEATKIFGEVGHSFNLFSDRQVAEVLFTELALPRVGKDKMITDAVLRGVCHPVAGLIADYRKSHVKE